jgi:DNA-directed RNA polymerase I and III subunit RPAC1
MYYDSSVYTGMLDWTPSGEQSRKYKGKEPRPVDPDILLVKLRPGQVSQSLLVVLLAWGGS